MDALPGLSRSSQSSPLPPPLPSPSLTWSSSVTSVNLMEASLVRSVLAAREATSFSLAWMGATGLALDASSSRNARMAARRTAGRDREGAGRWARRSVARRGGAADCLDAEPKPTGQAALAAAVSPTREPRTGLLALQRGGRGRAVKGGAGPWRCTLALLPSINIENASQGHPGAGQGRRRPAGGGAVAGCSPQRGDSGGGKGEDSHGASGRRMGAGEV